jgi:UDP-N-acetylmuramoyl-L-alanyl-D-glutamate--2,6-diaminopimelate ligase
LADPIRPTRAPAPWAEPYTTVGVTGTNGKTSTTMMVASALGADGSLVLAETTIGYSLGGQPLEVPRTVAGYLRALELGAGKGARRAAIEVTSEALARGTARLWRFDVGVFTNLSPDHLSAHGSFEHYLASKAQLFVHLGPGRTAVLNAGDPASLLLERVIPGDVRKVFYHAPSRGLAARAADLAAASIEVGLEGTRVTLVSSPMAEELGGSVSTPLVGEVFAENALAALLGAVACGVPPRTASLGIASTPAVPGRFEVIAREPAVVVDYAHTEDALARTLDTCRRIATERAGRVLLVFGAGGERDREKREPMGRAAGTRADVAIVTTDNPRREEPTGIAAALAAGVRAGGHAELRLEPDRRRAIGLALSEARPADVVLVAGKGHEQGQLLGDRVEPFSDADVVREHLAGRAQK